MKYAILLLFGLLSTTNVWAQENIYILEGPMPGHYSDSTELYWVLLEKAHTALKTKTSLKDYLIQLKKRPEVKGVQLKTQVLLNSLQVAHIHVDKKPAPIQKDTLEFLTGSCAFQYPFPLNVGAKRKRLNKIFGHMAKEKADFMVWTGDNVYYLAGQWNSYKGMVKKNLRSRRRSPINTFLKSCPQYAIWDDHDYGPNDSDARFGLKDTALTVFKKFWANPYYGTKETPGVFCHFSQDNCDFFLLDSRYHCIKKGKPELLGQAQLNWLIEKLKASTADFKFIFNGTQFLPVAQSGETWGKYKKEQNSFLEQLKKHKITGVVLVSGDRHYTELNKVDRSNSYPLYEFTCSPLTSFTDPTFPKNNPIRVENTAFQDQNYGRVKIFYEKGDRICLLETFDTKGRLVWEHRIPLSTLQ